MAGVILGVLSILMATVGVLIFCVFVWRRRTKRDITNSNRYLSGDQQTKEPGAYSEITSESSSNLDYDIVTDGDCYKEEDVVANVAYNVTEAFFKMSLNEAYDLPNRECKESNVSDNNNITVWSNNAYGVTNC